MTANYTQLTNKLTLIFWPCLRLTLFFLAGYGLLDAVLLNWRPAFDPPNEFWKLLGPGAVAAVLVLWRIWPRLSLLTTSKGRGDTRVLLGMTTVITMAFGTNYLHEYLRASLGHLQVLESPAAFTINHLGSYYRFQQQYQTPRYAGSEPQTSTLDKGRTLVFHLYIATPLFASPADTGRPAAIWQGLHYSAQTNNRASEAEKKKAYQAFVQRTTSQFNQEKFVAPAGYYERIPNTNERAAYLRAARHTGLSAPAAPLLLLQPGLAPLATLRRSAAYHLLGWLGGGMTLFFVVLLFPYLSATSAQVFQSKNR